MIMDKTYLGVVGGVPFFKSNEVVAEEVPVEYLSCTRMHRMCPNCRSLHSNDDKSENEFRPRPVLHMRIVRRDRYTSEPERRLEAFNFPMRIQWNNGKNNLTKAISLSEHDAQPALFDTGERYLYQIAEFGYRLVFRCNQCGSVIITDPIYLGNFATLPFARGILVWDDIMFVSDQNTGYFISREPIYSKASNDTSLGIVKKYQDMTLLSVSQRVPSVQLINGIRPIVDVNCTDSRNATDGDICVYRNDVFQINGGLNGGQKTVDMKELSYLHRIYCAYSMDQIYHGTFYPNEMDPLLRIVRDYGIDKIKPLTTKDHWR